MFEWSGRSEATLESLRQLVAARVALDALEAHLVAEARRAGCRWSELGPVLGLTPQGASKRHRAAAAGAEDDADPFY